MDGTTPPGPPEGLGSRGPGGSGASGRDDLLFPAATDGAWRSGDRADSRSRWVLVGAVVATVVVLAVISVFAVRALRGATSAGPTATGSGSAIGSLDVGA